MRDSRKIASHRYKNVARNGGSCKNPVTPRVPSLAKDSYGTDMRPPKTYTVSMTGLTRGQGACGRSDSIWQQENLSPEPAGSTIFGSAGSKSTDEMKDTMKKILALCMLTSSAMAAPSTTPLQAEKKETGSAFELSLVCFNVLGVHTKGRSNGRSRLNT